MFREEDDSVEPEWPSGETPDHENPFSGLEVEAEAMEAGMVAFSDMGGMMWQMFSRLRGEGASDLQAALLTGTFFGQMVNR